MREESSRDVIDQWFSVYDLGVYMAKTMFTIILE